ncbi:hypothetical protein F5Y05DRAFT_418191 [Hypoxylon sp. FL0543]|nr:hypothetical protein F5Y05DRAFT_418191 [Hypoxylon sp. FL0543]
MSTFYEFRLLNLQERFQIDPINWGLLKAHEDYRAGRITLHEMANQARSHRFSLLDFTARLAVTAGKITRAGGDTAKHHAAVMGVVNEIIAIAMEILPEPKRIDALPVEVRWRIYHHYVNIPPELPLVPRGSRAEGYLECECDNPGALDRWAISARHWGKKLDIRLALASKFMRDDFLGYLYNRHLFYFPCVCNMAYHISTNAILASSLAHVKFHWAGVAAEEGLRDLGRLKTVKHLTVVISTRTTDYTTEHEQMLARYFGRRHHRKDIQDAVGIWKLIALRGIDAVEVEHIARWRDTQRQSSDRKALDQLLRATVTLPRECEECTDD